MMLQNFRAANRQSPGTLRISDSQSFSTTRIDVLFVCPRNGGMKRTVVV